MKELLGINTLEKDKINIKDVKKSEEKREVNLQNNNIEQKEKQEDNNIKKEIIIVEQNLNAKDILIDNTIREFEIIKKSSEDKIINEHKNESDKIIKKVDKMCDSKGCIFTFWINENLYNQYGYEDKQGIKRLIMEYGQLRGEGGIMRGYYSGKYL